MSFCLTDFVPVRMSEPVPQALTLELSAYGFAKAYCRNHGINDAESFGTIIHETRQKFEKFALSPSVIKRRQLVFFPRLSDISFSNGEFTVSEPEHDYMQLFDSYETLKAKDIKTRHSSYAKIADDCLGEMYSDVEQAPDDLIHVTCSGYLAPSPVERMVAGKEWFNTTVTHSYHMGCYGAFPAIKMAHGFLSSSQFAVTKPKDRVDIVHTEVLSVHRDIEELKAENIITMTLFADGFIKYSMVTEDHLRERGLRGLRVLAFNEHLLPDSANDMTWVPGSTRFHMTLSVMVPVVIKQSVRPFVEELLQRVGVDFERDKRRLIFAIHPGGPRIVEHIQEALGLEPDQVAISNSVFTENGNMSSATVPHILKQIVEEPSIPAGARVVSLAFGPGLTITGLVAEKI
ncbi:MAG: 3-oxoacyl-[acyl-carrier-protein] synthase III C-terminal domain-containing protein [Methylocystis sp.]|uniref:3-oxoacyl-[acyl-carrier-protein] synthase III C-terminal domain-containing protein n=1 Tax=Methylocystis sp. TaxID=1911079 RepID=UPI003D11C86A